jgi:ParB family chromosome partitioning protein
MTQTQEKGLGKGLSALMSEGYSESLDGEGQVELPIDKIVPGRYQPRKHFDEQALNDLKNSIVKNGLMQPIVVRKTEREEQYEIVAGERRWRAAQLASLTEVPVIVRDINDQTALELAIVENVQRQDLSPLEEALGYQRLIDDFAYTQEGVAETVGKSRSHIANLLRLLALPDKIKIMLEEGELTMGHARALIGVENALEIAQRAIDERLSVRQVEKLAKGEGQEPTQKSNSSPKAPKETKAKSEDILALEETLSENLGLKVSINDHGGQNGDIVISYHSLTELDDILRRLGGTI